MKNYEVMILLLNTMIKAIGSKEEVSAIFNQYRNDKEIPIRTRITENNKVIQEKIFGDKKLWDFADEEWEYNQEIRRYDVYKVNLFTRYEECVYQCKNRKDAINMITFLMYNDDKFGKEYFYTIG